MAIVVLQPLGKSRSHANYILYRSKKEKKSETADIRQCTIQESKQTFPFTDIII